jgi:hypothetical protein
MSILNQSLSNQAIVLVNKRPYRPNVILYLFGE